MPEDNFISIGEAMGVDPPAETPEGETTPTATSPETTPAATPEVTPVVSDLGSTFAADMQQQNKDFTLPDNFNTMNDQERYNFMKDTITSTRPQSDDPFLDAYSQAKDRGLSPQEFMQQQNLTETVKGMTDRDFLVEDLLRENGKSEERPQGWERVTVEEYVDNMNEVDRFQKAKDRKDNLLGQLDQQSEQNQQKIKAQIREQAEAANSGQVLKTVDALFSKMATSKDIGGIPHTPKDQAEFKQVFTDAVSINPETGYSRTRELLSNDEVLYKALYLYNKVEGDNSLRGFLSSFKEEYKQDILDRTRLAPRQEGGNFQDVAIPESKDFV